jgi:hypothetical protein
VALFWEGKNTVDIIDVASGEMVKEHEVEGSLTGHASVQRNIAAMVVCEPQHGVHVMELKSGKVLCKFILPDGENARIALSKDSITLAVGSDNGLWSGYHCCGSRCGYC